VALLSSRDVWIDVLHIVSPSASEEGIEQAQQLGQLVAGMLCHVNLIPLNPTAGYGGRPSSRARVEAFQQELARYGVSSTVRVRRGIDIQAGCGQLRDRVVAEASAQRRD
jgi:23S rRNA (adenine2503-C2)-methyltransferase